MTNLPGSPPPLRTIATAADRLLPKLKNVSKNATGWTALCPAHADSTPSLSISRRSRPGGKPGLLVHCYAGCDTSTVLSAVELASADLFDQQSSSQPRRIVAEYQYRDERCDPLFEVLRYDPKDFRQRRPDGRGGYVWKLGNVRRVLFRLPELVAADPTATVYVTEGEKDAEALAAAGHVATCAPHGAGKWSRVATHAREVLAGRAVVVIADCDEPGRDHARDVAASLADVAASVTVVEAATGKDVTDHLGAGLEVADLVKIASTTATGSAPRLVDWIAECSPPPSNGPELGRQAAELVAGSEVFAGPDGHRYSDVGNARRLIDIVGNTLRYVPKWSRWIVYSDGCWHIDYGNTRAAFSASRVAVELLENLATVSSDPHHLRALLRHTKRSESAQGIAATLTVASSIPSVAVDHERLDADPALLNVANGTIDLHTGTLRPHDPDDLLTLQSPVLFDAEAAAPEFASFVARILPNHELRAFVQRLAGLALVGDQPEQILPISLGDGANGKSTLTKIIADVLGNYSVVASRDVLLALKHDTHPTAKADLFRRRFAHSGELPRGARLDESQVKELTGGDRIKARRMREDHWEFYPSHLLWIHANHRPTIEGTDDGIWRRVLLIPFDVQVPEAERDPKLAQRILTTESPGVLNWMLAGLADYQGAGLRIPNVVLAATRQYRDESDTVSRFITEAGLLFDPAAWMPAADLLDLHERWYEIAGLAEAQQPHYRRVLHDLDRRGLTTGRRSTSGDRVRIWKGLGIADLDPPADERATAEEF